MSGTILETDRLLLRRRTEDDIPALVSLWSDPEVTRRLGGPRERRFLEEVFGKTARELEKEHYDLWPGIEKESGLLVGHRGLLDKDIEGRVALIEPSHAGSEWVAVKVGMRFSREVPRPGGARKRIYLIEAGGTTGADTDRVIPPAG